MLPYAKTVLFHLLKPKEAVVGTFVTNHQRRSETKVKSKPKVELGTLQG